MSKPRRADPAAVLSLTVNGHTLTGECRRGKHGRWRFECPSWPALAARHAGADSPAGIIADFTWRALAPARVVREHVRRLMEGPPP